MKFSKLLQPIDIALILPFIPIFFLLTPLMQIFVIIGIVGIIKKVNYKILAVIGFIAFFLSFYNAFNFYGISKFKTFILMIISLLTIAVILQRIDKIDNFYLKVSPVIFFMFDILAFQNIYMLFYSIFILFAFIVVSNYYRVKDYRIALIFATKLFLFSLPLIVILFIFFPRYYIKKSPISFKTDAVVTGFNDELKIGKNSVVKSNAIVMEAKFDKMPNDLYFRGEVLYKNLGYKWVKLYKSIEKDNLIECKERVNYSLKEYPTFRKNVFIYGVSYHQPKNYVLTKYYTLRSEKIIKTPINLKLTACSKYKIVTNISPIALEYNQTFNKKSFSEVKDFRKIKNDEKRLEKLKAYFISKKLKYTLSPPEMNPFNVVDDLFAKKSGYCIHFASAFATLSRMVNIPSRIVTGFVANEKLKNYVVIHSKDAHAWVEVYLKNRGWVKIDPTLFISLKDTNQSVVNSQNNSTNKEIKIRENRMLWLMYVKFNIEEWVLYYNFFKQKQLFKKLENREFLIKFTSSILLLILISIILTQLLKKRDVDFYEKQLLKKLAKKGIIKPKGETLYKFLTDINLIEIRDLIYKIKFDNISNKKELLKKLRGVRV